MIVAAGLAWTRRAVCFVETSDAPELWTPERRPARTVRVHLEQMCSRCPVLQQCAANAVVTAAEGGMYAGVWVPERKANNRWHEAMEQLCGLSGLSVRDIGIDELGVSA